MRLYLSDNFLAMARRLIAFHQKHVLQESTAKLPKRQVGGAHHFVGKQ
jgi:hypothetical protein